MKIIKKTIKYILKKNGWRMEKIVIPRECNTETPRKELLDAMKNCKGILHFGAHRGSEAPIYEWFGKNVIWFEANPKIFSALKENLIKHKNQKAFCALLGEKDDEEIDFYLSNNDSASSSIYRFGDFTKKFWPNRIFKMTGKLRLKFKSLDTLIKEKGIEILNYDHWIIDVQGAELLLLKGSKESLKFCKSIFVEVSNEEIYKGGAQFNELEKFLEKHNFVPIWKPIKEHSDVLFLNKNLKK